MRLGGTLSLRVYARAIINSKNNSVKRYALPNVYNVHNNLPMNTLRIRNMFLLVTALAVMFLLACGFGSSKPHAPATVLTGQEAVGVYTESK